MSFFNRFKDDGKSEVFERKQRLFADKVRPLFNADAQFDKSDEDLAWLKNRTSIEENARLSGGAEEDADYILRTLSGAARHYRAVYGENPSEGQLAAMGGALENCGNWRELAMNNGLDRKIITEATDGASSADNFSVVPHFMTIAALLPLTAVSHNFCHSIGNKRTDKVTVHELEELVGPNPYGIPEGARINGFYEGGLSNARRRVSAGYEDAGMDFNKLSVLYTCKLSYPATKGRVFVIVNRRTVAADNGAGGFNIIGDGEYDDGLKVSIESSSVDYWDTSAKEASISVDLKFDAGAGFAAADAFKSAIDSIPVWFRVETDTENYPEFISETQYAARSFDLYSESYILSAGMTLRAVLKSIRNMRRNIPDLAFSRLLAIVAADMDRKTLRDLSDYAEGEEEFSLKLNEYRGTYEQWARIREPMNRVSEEMRSDTGGAAGVRAFIGGPEFKLLFMNMGDKWAKISAAARNPALANQPHYIGKFEGYHLFYNPLCLTEDSAEVAIGVGRGERVSQCGAVLGMASPPLLYQSAALPDLTARCSVCGEFFSDQPPEARKYVRKLKLTDLPAQV